MITKFAIALLIAPMAQSYQLHLDTDFFGGDMYPIENVNSSLKCMNHCEEIRNCRVATWCEPICFIKDTKTNKSEKLGCVSFDMFPEYDSQTGSSSKSTLVPTIETETPTEMPTETPTEMPTETKSDANTLSSASAALIFILTTLL